jgi:UDP-glucose 4-epimerase
MVGSRALVTGASGFIGKALVRRLTADGLEVHAVSRQDRAGAPGVHWHALDLTDGDAVRSLVAEVAPRTVFHLASLVAGSRAVELVLPMLQANLVAAVNLMGALVGTDVERLVLAGSLEEPEGVDAVPASPYAAAKGAATSYGRLFHARYGLPVVNARLFMVYGPDQNDEAKLIPYVLRSLASGRSPTLGPGTRPVDWVYVDDVVDGLCRCALVPDAIGRRLDLGSGRAETVRTVVERLFALAAPGAVPTFGGLAERPDEQVRVADVAATEAVLGWSPKIELEEGLRRTVAWYREHPAPST